MVVPQILSTPMPTPFQTYKVPEIPRKAHYTIFFVGDSMTFALGPHPFRFSNLVNQAYEQQFIIDNYSIGSLSILSLEDLITLEANIDGITEPPIVERDFDILIVESFGHNPLSQLSLDEGLKTQEEVLDSMMLRLIDSHPNSLVIFLATIAPDELNYARGVLDLSPELRLGFARERRAYIENFIGYAKSHNIPLINMYEKSFDEDGLVKTNLISSDNIHPSQEGIEFIQEEMAKFIIENGYLPR